jgi:hypothetical protein
MARPRVAFAGAAGRASKLPENHPGKLALLNPAIAGPMFYREMKTSKGRRGFGAFLAGKLIGVALAVGIGMALLWYFDAHAFA